MNSLLDQLGINWSLFLSQAVNFFILLVILTFFVYKPLIKIIKKRNAKIKEGLDKAEEADIRLKEVDGIAKEKINQAEQESINIIKTTEAKAKDLANDLQKQAEEHQKKTLEQIKLNAAYAQEQANKEVLKSAASLVKKALIRTVELNPHEIDEALINKAVNQIKENEV